MADDRVETGGELGGSEECILEPLKTVSRCKPSNDTK